MVKNHKLALSLADASWSKVVTMLEYKALWHDRIVQKVGTFYPSSQTCNHCGFINPLVKDLKLRAWSCPGCNTYNLRDMNAALNHTGRGIENFDSRRGYPGGSKRLWRTCKTCFLFRRRSLKQESRDL